MTRKEQRARWKERNPVMRLSPRVRDFLMGYVNGGDAREGVCMLWPKVKDVPLKIAQLFNNENFQAAFHYLVDAQMTRESLAYRNVLIADRAKKSTEKINALRMASQIMGHIRNGQDASSGYKAKTQKSKIPAVPVDELREKLIRMAEKAAESGHRQKAS